MGAARVHAVQPIGAREEDLMKLPPRLTRCAVILATFASAACGGDGGGGSSAPAPLGRTTFTGNVMRPPGASALTDGGGAVFPVQVCVAGTGFCTEVDETGAFTLAADVGGDVTLQFEGPDFSARLRLNDVPNGATVRIVDIRCSTVTGGCQAESVQIVAPFNSAPICDGAEARPAVLWPPDHRMVRIAIGGLVDPDGDALAVAATDVFSNEAVDAPGSGNTAPDAQLAPLAVRAERSGQGSGRLYTIAFVADDGRGGRCSGVVEVCVPHDQGNGSSC